MKKGTYVEMEFIDGWIHGITVEDEAESPSKKDPERKVIRVKWSDGSESIENTKVLYAMKA